MIASAEEAIGWPYVSPGSNNSKGIDCSGLFVKMFRDQGSRIAHGSNSIFREHCSETGELRSVSQLQPGMAVFKIKSWTDADKNNRWYGRPPGNLYHIGFVTSVNPLTITHATTPVAKQDTKLGEWAYWGKLKKVNYNNGGESPIMDEVISIVTADSGNTVKLRAKPSTSCNQYWDVPIGTEVTVLKSGEEWSKIKYLSHIGFMMTKFLRTKDGGEISGSVGETVEVSKEELNKAYKILEGVLGQFLPSKGDVEKAYDIIGDMLGLRG